MAKAKAKKAAKAAAKPAAKKKAAASKPAAPAAAPKAPTPKAGASAPAKPQAASTAVLDEMLKATGEAGPKKGETLPEFVLRLATATATLSDDAYNALSKEAREWSESNGKLYNDEKFDELVALPGMPGYVEAGTETPDPKSKPDAPAPAANETSQETPNPEEGADMATKSKGGKKAAKKAAKAATKTPKTPAEKKERELRTDSAAYQVRLAVVKKPDITFEKVCENLGLKGKEASPTGHNHNMFQHAKLVMKIAEANGYSKG